jgi:D-psicose/D-tagatose/L-ribulose 3-epimerase
MQFRYSVVCGTSAWMGYDFVEATPQILEAVREAGYEGADLPADAERMDPTKLRRAVESLGLKVPAVMGVWGSAHSGEHHDLAGSSTEARRRAMDYSKRSIDLAAAVSARYFNICASQPAVPQVPFPDLPIEILRKNFRDSTFELCEYAAARDVYLVLEPLNMYEAYPGVLTTVGEAIRLIDELGIDRLGLQPDVFHMNIAEASIPDALRAAGNRIKHIHVNETNHYPVGSGHADHRSIIRTLKEIEFDGFLSVYMPYTTQDVFHLARTSNGDSAPRPDVRSVMAEQLQFLKQIESTVDAEGEINREQ